ncbi:MAG TPA: helix-turn-helix domain-containing protein [Clostridia bacterium]|nr:helix-turn-helix domain-containing protein [Clostridia bacterium]
MTEEIANMTFEELCACVKSQYNNILPESAYESPESLSEALKDIEKDKGYRNRYNVTAFMILQACVRMQQRIFTVADIADYTGLSKHTISECIRRWIKYDFRYLTRLQKRIKAGAYKYKIRKHGIETYIALKKRIRRGFDLNQMQRTPRRIDCYFYINDIGKAKGLTEADLPQIVI